MFIDLPAWLGYRVLCHDLFFGGECLKMLVGSSLWGSFLA